MIDTVRNGLENLKYIAHVVWATDKIIEKQCVLTQLGLSKLSFGCLICTRC